MEDEIIYQITGLAIIGSACLVFFLAAIVKIAFEIIIRNEDES